MFRFIQLFTEMRVVGTPDKMYKIVAFRDKIWIFQDDELDGEESQEKITEIFELMNMDRDSEDIYNFYDLGSVLTESRKDVLVGEVNGDELEMSGAYEAFDPQSSTLLKKVFAELNLETLKVNYETGEDSMYFDFQIEDSIPDFAYHGTYSNYLYDILRLGIRPNMRETNWGRIEHKGKIFITTKFKTAAFHASRATMQRKGYPTIIRFMIPDKGRIIPDYDMETEANPEKTSQRYYDDITSQFAQTFDMEADWSSDRLSKEIGIYGYSGSIMPKFIREVYILTENPEDITYDPSNYYNFDAEYIKKRFREYGEYFEDYFEGDIAQFLLMDEYSLDEMIRDPDEDDEEYE